MYQEMDTYSYDEWTGKLCWKCENKKVTLITIKCSACNGKGNNVHISSMDGHPFATLPCKSCDMSGKIEQYYCEECLARGLKLGFIRLV
jgi:DnaJ-class molecular chaperone